MRQGRWLAVALGWALLLPLAAAGGNVTIGTRGSYPLSDGFTYLEDPDQNLSLDAVLQPAQQARFQPLSGTGAGVNFGDLAGGQGRGAGRTRARHGLGDHGHHEAQAAGRRAARRACQAPAQGRLDLGPVHAIPGGANALNRVSIEAPALPALTCGQGG